MIGAIDDIDRVLRGIDVEPGGAIELRDVRRTIQQSGSARACDGRDGLCVK
jgi:hypothetical protein